MIALVTGASGFIGRALCARLEADGAMVRAFTRASGGDIENVRDWSPFVDGCDVVFHLAARVHSPDASADSYQRVNVDATMSLMQAAQRAGVKRFVFASSVKAAAESSGQVSLRESDPPEPQDPYGRSKRDAELALLATGALATIVRFPLVYGPGVRANFLRLMRTVDRGIPLPLASVRNRRSLLFVGNAVDAMIVAARNDAASQRTFYVADGEDLSTPELVRRIARAVDRPARLVSCPPALLRAAATLLGKRGAADRLLGSLAVDTTAIRETLQWRPPFSVDQGLAATAAWYKQNR